MYNDLVDVAWRAFVEIYEPYPSVVATGAIQRAFIWFRFRFFACRVSVEFSSVQLRLFFSHVHTLVATAHPSLSICLLFCCSLTCDANANVAAAAYVAHILCDCHWVRGWDLNESASEPCFSSFFSVMLIEMRQRRDISKQGAGRGSLWMSREGGARPSVNSRRSFLFIRLPAQLPRKQPQAESLCLFLFLITNSESCLRHNIQVRVDVCVFKHS